MVLIHLDEELTRLEEEREMIADMLRHLGADMRRLRGQYEDSGTLDKPETSKAVADLRYWLKVAHETEALITNVRRKQKGIAGDWALDLERARLEVGCRMARLRRCCGAGELSD
ncbi:hypothetical protein [Salipiger sp. PrR002]|uniref:hypothetical protein n=1 Tax=Salipiger sp. PrR002 TaxID=2706489 RepID=UPI001F35B6B9|nr:hypothetical protein [Salipiger sp. PrR002]